MNDAPNSMMFSGKKKKISPQHFFSSSAADDLKDYVGYIYYEHIRDGGKPRTVKTCLYYKDEGGGFVYVTCQMFLPCLHNGGFKMTAPSAAL